MPLSEYIYDEVSKSLETLDYTDNAVEHQFVTQVREVDGLISVLRSSISVEDITSGILPIERGGLGLNYVDGDELLIGSDDGSLRKRKFVTEFDNDRNAFATVGAIKDYIEDQTAGLTGAMHFIGETSVIINQNSGINPQIPGYDFSLAQPGDVILANNTQEYVWTGTNWRLLGDEGSYAIKGSIKNVDIAENASIAQSKIDGLEDALASKVDKEEGKTLISIEEKQKLQDIEEGAQVNLIEHIVVNDTEYSPNAEKTINLNIPILTQEQIDKINAADANLIEHIFVNNVELQPSVINQLAKSVNIVIPFSQSDKDKLDAIEAQAQKNKIEHILINGTEITPSTINSEPNSVNIVLDENALTFSILQGARYPSGINKYTDIDITDKKLELSKVAATGNINDLIQDGGSYVIFNCGTSTEVV